MNLGRIVLHYRKIRFQKEFDKALKDTLFKETNSLTLLI